MRRTFSPGVQTLSFDPPIEALQEFNVSISHYPAELTIIRADSHSHHKSRSQPQKIRSAG